MTMPGRERERDKYVALYIDFIYINKLSNYLLYLILSYLILAYPIFSYLCILHMFESYARPPRHGYAYVKTKIEIEKKMIDR